MLLAEEYNLGLCLSRVHRRHSDCVLLVDTDRTLVPGNASQSLVDEDGALSPLSIWQQSSIAELSLIVEDGFVSLPSILSQSSVPEQF